MNETISRYEKMVEQFPQNELARFSLGKALFDEGLFDLALDFADCSRVSLSASAQAGEAHLRKSIGLFVLLVKKVSVLADVPGLAVTRTALAGVSPATNSRVTVFHRPTSTCPGVNVSVCPSTGFPDATVLALASDVPSLTPVTA
jgi:hypothetical protein